MASRIVLITVSLGPQGLEFGLERGKGDNQGWGSQAPTLALPDLQTGLGWGRGKRL